MPNYTLLTELIEDSPLAPLQQFTTQKFFDELKHGDLSKWLAIIDSLPSITPSSLDLKSGVKIGSSEDCSSSEMKLITEAMRSLIPWRKGPFTLFDLVIDTEWHSDWKWQRLVDQICPLAGRTVLDVGCGNGYHCLRMAGENAKLVVGIDPHLPYVMQFLALQKFFPSVPAFVLPVTLQQLPTELRAFDTVFSMGVLYHRRSPLDHLLELKNCLRTDGELVLETLVVEGTEGYSLTPNSRYARMSNVWFIPSCLTVKNWLARCGYKNIHLVNVCVTSIEEQHKTHWMPFDSLIDGLNPDDHSTTIEGHPAPKRAIFTSCI